MLKQGEIVLIAFPFTDLTTGKKRPVLILSDNYYNDATEDIIVAAITSNLTEKDFSVKITKSDLSEGDLLRESCIRADKLYTLSQSMVIKKFGKVKK